MTLGHEGQGLAGREGVSAPRLPSVLASHPLACFWTDAGTASRTATLEKLFIHQKPLGLAILENIFNSLLVLDVQKNEWYFIAVILYDTVTIP